MQIRKVLTIYKASLITVSFALSYTSV